MNKKLVISVLIVMSLLVGLSIFSAATAEYPPTPTPTLTPSPSPTPTPSLSESIAEEHKKHPMGEMVFNAPETMTVGKKVRIVVRITMNTTENLTEGLIGGGVPQVEEIKVSRNMEVRLKGKNFDRESLFIHEKQIVGSEEFTEWAWDVTPLDLGVQELHLLSAVWVVTHYGEWGIGNPVRDKQIDVKLGGVDGIVFICMEFIKKHWQWIVGTLIAIITIIIHVMLVVRRSGKK